MRDLVNKLNLIEAWVPKKKTDDTVEANSLAEFF
jgi:hypothetical protein